MANMIIQFGSSFSPWWDKQPESTLHATMQNVGIYSYSMIIMIKDISIIRIH